MIDDKEKEMPVTSPPRVRCNVYALLGKQNTLPFLG